MPVDFTGYWKMLANENFEEYLRALDVNVALRKIANLLKPDKEIVQDGDHMIIRTLSTFRNYIMDFQVGKEFEEDLTGIDDRKCLTTVSWDGDKLECVQKGEKEGRGWTQWIEGDELHLVGCWFVGWWGTELGPEDLVTVEVRWTLEECPAAGPWFCSEASLPRAWRRHLSDFKN
uniref:Retinol binding protein 1 n=2 Tax=Ailuropoda melanoleuca TaxID=9646 RepID=A0A7N5K760_AILME